MKRYHDIVSDSARWEGFPFRPGDIVISTPAKCGTTWMQRLCSLVLGIEPTKDRPMSVISPWVDMLTRPLDDVVADLEGQRHRRFMKTHTPLDGLPFVDDVTYITVGRDPRDVALSWSHHMDNMDLERFVNLRIEAVGLDDLAEVMPGGPPEPPPDDIVERFWVWADVDDSIPNHVSGVVAELHHLQTFWDRRDHPNVHLFHYAQMQADLPGQIRVLADALDVDVDDGAIATMADAASFERMRASAGQFAP